MHEFLVRTLLRSERFTDRKNNEKPKTWSSSYLNKPSDISFDSKAFQSYTATDTGENSLQFDITLKTTLSDLNTSVYVRATFFVCTCNTCFLSLHLLHLQEFQLVWFNPHWDWDLDLERDLLPKKNTLDQKWNLAVAKHFNHEAFMML